MSLVLRRKGYSVATAKDGPAAIAMLTERSFDTVFMDIKMPLMDGVETYRGIKQIRPDAVVVMMTAYALDDMVNDALLEGAYGVLSVNMASPCPSSCAEKVTRWPPLRTGQQLLPC